MRFQSVGKERSHAGWLTGGSRGPADSIVKGTTSCTLASNSTDVSFTVNPPDNPCAVSDLVVTGGSKPYTVSVMAG